MTSAPALGLGLARVARRAARLALGLLLVGWAAFRLMDLAFPFPVDALAEAPASPVVSAADGRWMRVGLTDEEERALPLGDAPLSPHLVRALVSEEDRRFFQHGGVDLRALLRASVRLAAGRREGGSTLSMQAARLLAPSPRTVPGKLVQVFRALQLEERASKEQILRLYLDRAPFGGNLRGVGAAARAWFATSPSALSPAQAALLVSVLPAPARFSPLVDPEGARRRRDGVLRAMRSEGALNDEGLARALAEPLGLVPTSFPDRATHAWLQAGEGATTIDLALQAAVERVAEGASGPDGLAIVLVEHGAEPGPCVRALVGDRQPAATRLDATRRPRAAGSTLKPFLWATALDRGRIAPGTLLLDLPWSSPEWEPRDMDGGQRGPVPASEALAASLNLPAVRLAADLPAEAFLRTLHAAGFARVRAPDSPTAVDLALGSDDVSPLELVGAYAALARGGLRRTLRLKAEAPDAAPVTVCSPGAAALVTRMLAEPSRARPAGAPAQGVAWKTGTSSRRRDAWAVGFTSRFTAVVWRGWLDGRPDPDLLGARSAAPLLFAVLGAADPTPHPFVEPVGVRAVAVCRESGLAAGPDCSERREDLVPEGAAPLAPCRVHRRLPVDPASGRLCCARCQAAHRAQERPFALFGPQEAAWRRKQGLAVAAPPAHAADCSAPVEPAELAPLFLTPRAGQQVAADAAGRVLVRAVSLEGGPLTLLVDGEVRARLPDDALTPVPLAVGPHALTLLTVGGRASTLRVTVAPPD